MYPYVEPAKLSESQTRPPTDEIDVSSLTRMRDSEGNGEIFKENNTMRCLQNKKVCFSLWRVDPNNKDKQEIIKQGAFICFTSFSYF